MWWSKSFRALLLRVPGPGRVDHRPEHAGHEGLPAEEQREVGVARDRRELADARMLDDVRQEEVRREAVRRARPPSEVGEEHARVEEHPVAELLHALEELHGADLLVEEAERGTRGA